MPGEQQQQGGQQQQQQGGQQQQQQQGGQQQAAWHGVPETDTAGREYITNKGWQSPADVIKSYQGAEKLIGRDPSQLLVIPRADDPAGLAAVYDKLGRPATADKYEFAKPGEGRKLDDNYVTWAREAFHKLGFSGAQAKGLTEAHDAYIGSVIAKQESDYNVSVAADKAALQAKWKDGTERMLGLAKATANGLGFDGALIDAIEKHVGYAKTMEMFAEMGKRLGEDNFVGGDKTPKLGGLMTPEEAKGEWDKAVLDPAFVAALKDKSHAGHAQAQKKQTDLFKIMYPEK